MAKSDHKLQSIIDLRNGQFMFTYNHQLVVESDGHESYEFDHIQLPLPVNRDKIIAALIEQRYSKDYQIAILFNKDDGIQDHAEEYATYQEFRQEIKRVVDKTLNT